MNREYTAEELSSKWGITVKSVTDLTYFENFEETTDHLIDPSKFRQTLKIEIFENGKQAVLDAIKIAEQSNDVYSARPNYIFYPELSAVTNSVNDTDLPQDIDPRIITPAPTNDPYSFFQYALDNSNIQQAWDITMNYEVKVGVLDTGIDGTHPDLDGKIALFAGHNYTSDEGDQWVDTNGHGTHVAGIIAAEINNGIGIAGVCDKVSLTSYRVVEICTGCGDSKCSGYHILTDWVVSAIVDAALNDIPILNLSLGGYGSASGSDLQAAMEWYRGLLVCSAGNGKKNDLGDFIGVNTDLPENYHVPSGCDGDNIISVASIDEYDQLAGDSNFGVETVDIAAPGVDIISTVPMANCPENCTDPLHAGIYRGYHQNSGTSMAAPYVAGIAALLKSYDYTLTTAEVKRFILEGATPVSALQGKILTGGKVNAYNSLILAINYSSVAQYGDLFTGCFTNDMNQPQVACFKKISSTQTNILIWDIVNGTVQFDNPTVAWIGDAAYNFLNDRVTVGDFNGDGFDDLAALYNVNGLSRVYVWRGGFTGFTKMTSNEIPLIISSEYAIGKVTAGDYNGDGKDDIAAFVNTGKESVGLYLWLGTSTTLSYQGSVWSESRAQEGFFDYKDSIVTGDFNNDGYDDIALLTCRLYMTHIDIYVWYGSNSGLQNSTCVAVYVDHNMELTVAPLLVGDFNGDGYDDLAAVYDYTNDDLSIFVWYGKATGFEVREHEFFNDYFYAVSLEGRVFVVDYNNDGKDDIMGFYDFNGENQALYKWYLLPSGYFAWQQ